MVTPANEKDIAALNVLVNSAYRGESSKQGWTTEADLLDGIRTDEQSILDFITRKDTVLLVCRNERNELIGCVHLQEQAQQMYLGMLTVSPTLQGAGIG